MHSYIYSLLKTIVTVLVRYLAFLEQWQHIFVSRFEIYLKNVSRIGKLKYWEMDFWSQSFMVFVDTRKGKKNKYIYQPYPWSPCDLIIWLKDMGQTIILTTTVILSQICMLEWLFSAVRNMTSICLYISFTNNGSKIGWHG